MLKIKPEVFPIFEKLYPGITETSMRFENAVLPLCSKCGSQDTADVQVGIIGRTIHHAGATTKFHLILNGLRPGSNFCIECKQFFN